ncbi:ABC transporter ATP-binding protein [Dethiobacter alkaliphilus]|uniref:ABC transporter ATP-binding protein n=1 Tax=Dethiobacter alkaliphilus TaxID=427926 RepID=UPI0022272DDA|nr:oligopeptide/dipeptide ABC transporter ATP-binding protein [Dethiobacter alkaliphilus]MCW3489543.1 ATP-binding cassette domain-containing protein [Dethiobacter alkaliphilus]
MTALLEVKELLKYFSPPMLRAVDGVSFTVRKGETLGIVGESGCGKSTLGRVILRLLDPSGGQIFYNGKNITGLNSRQMLPYRKKMQIVFQDPAGALNPKLTIGRALGETLRVHRLAEGKKEVEEKVVSLLSLVGMGSEHLDRYPHQFSGGQRQRIVLARALAVQPEIMVCDEPVSALDVSIQAQIMNLLAELQETLGLSYIFIAHNLNVVKHISDRIAVMYLGKIVELADKQSLFDNPRHPYTQALLSAVPVADPQLRRKRIILSGEVPSPLNPPSGCRFRTRCPHAFERCAREEPILRQTTSNHQTACHLGSGPK